MTTTTMTEANRAASAAAQVMLTDDERQRCEIWTRVMGYHRPVASFNIGKQGEFAERLYFEQPEALTAEAGSCGR